MPKSTTFTIPARVTRAFSGLRSRWTMPARWATRTASAICAAIESALGRSSAPRRRISSRSEIPSMSSITMYITPPRVMPAS
ncbi:hypothetical protein WMF30_33600 [Sorangium sp. So ce134]